VITTTNTNTVCSSSSISNNNNSFVQKLLEKQKKPNLMFMGPYIVRIFQYISKRMQGYTVNLYLKTALHVSGGTSTHHQERIQLYIQHQVFVTPLILPAAIVAGSSNGVTNTICCTGLLKIIVGFLTTCHTQDT